MSEFAEAMEQAAAGGNESPASEPAVTAETGSEAPTPVEPTTTAPAPTPPGRTAPSSEGPKTGPQAAKPSTQVAAAPDAKMVPAPALQEARQQTKTLKDTYGWLPKDHVPALRGFYESFQSDPVTAVVDQLRQLMEHPAYSQQLRALMGVQQDAEPQPDYRDQETGELAFSSQQAAKWQRWHAKQDQQRFSAELNPLKEYVQTQRQREKLAEFQAQATKRAKELFGPLRQDPHFVENEGKIKERFGVYAGTMPGEAALYRAYSEIMREVVMPTLGRTERAELARSLNRKQGASSPNPARPGSPGAASRRPADFLEAAERLFGSR